MKILHFMAQSCDVSDFEEGPFSTFWESPPILHICGIANALFRYVQSSCQHEWVLSNRYNNDLDITLGVIACNYRYNGVTDK